jgi:AcrR family transcriptional regulator
VALPKQTTEQSQPTTERLLNAAAGLFRDRGYGAVGTAAIGAAVGMSAPAMYHHFSNKHELLFRCIERFMHVMLDRIETAAEAARDRLAAEQIRTIVSAHTECHIEQLLLARRFGRGAYSFEQLAVHLDPEHREVVTELERRTFRALRDVVIAGQASGELKPVDSTAVTFAMFAFGEQAVYWFSPSKSLSAIELGELHGRFATQLVSNGPAPSSSSTS